MDDKLKRLREILAEVSDIDSAAAVLGWDEATYMPPGGAAARAEQMATLRTLSHQRLTSPEVGDLLAALEAARDRLDEEAACLVRVARREYDRAVKVPPHLVAAFARATSRGYNTWVKARQEKDFAQFRPVLAEIIQLTLEITDAIGYKERRYDVLVDMHEPDLKTAQLDALFAELRQALVPLVQAIAERVDRVSNAVLHQPFDEQKQVEVCLEALRLIRFDLDRGRLDQSPHPFCTSFSSDDVRLTTRIAPNYFAQAFFGTLHEGGHGLYEQGIPRELRRSPLGTGASMGVHESQSRLWENLVGRSRDFWTYFLPRLKTHFPAQLESVSVEEMYRAVNRAEPSLIRVEADEVTYNLHIIIRYELERLLLEGKLAVQDLPEAWNSKYQTYLGVTPPDDALGVLQDVHWSGGMFGYFPSYTLGNVISVQLFDAAVQAHPEIPGQIRQGQMDTLLQWLRRHVHAHGAKFTPGELLVKATGQEMTPEPYLRYIKAKYSELYGL